MEDLIVELKLTVRQVNVILAHLVKGSFENVSELIMEIQQQGVPQVDAERQRLAENPVAEPLDEPVAFPPSDETT